MEDGDLWQAYADAEPREREEIIIATDDQEIVAMDASETAATSGSSSDDVASSATTERATDNVDVGRNVGPDVGPPVNIYAEAHRHAQIKAENAANGTNNNNVDEDESDNNAREGPHASLHLSSELKQNQKKRSSDDNNAQVSDSVDEGNNNGEDTIAEEIAPDQDAVDAASADDDAPKQNDAENESTESIDDDSTATTSETASESDTDSSAKEEDDDTTTKLPNRTRTVSEDEEDDEGPAKRILVDYASKLAGAQVLEKSPSFKGASNLLTGDSDKYAIAPCEDKKYVVIGLSEDILVKQIKLSNFERYSSHVREFQVLASQEYPAPSAEYWTLIGTFEANTRNGEQTFDLEEPAWARYLKFKFKSHFGAEHYCTLSQIKVHGSTMLQGFHEQWIESEKELEQEKEKENQQQQQQQDEEEIKEGEIDDGHEQEQHQENDVVDDKMVEEPAGLEDERDGADSKGAEDVPQPIEDTEGNNSDETEQNGAADSPPEKETPEEGENPPISEDVIDSNHPPLGDAEEEPTEKDDETITSNDVDASIPRDETTVEKEDVKEVPSETTVDDEKINEEGHGTASNVDKLESPSETNVADDEVNQADSNENAAACDYVEVDTIVEEDIVNVTASAHENTKTVEEIPSGTTAAETEKNIEDDTESSNEISDGHAQGENTSDETPNTSNKTDGVPVATPDPALTEKKTDDAKAVPSDSVDKSVPDTPKGDANSNIKDSPSKANEKEVAANTASPIAEKNDVKAMATTSAELVAKLSKRFPHASCIKDLDFHAFKKKTILSNASQIGQVPGPKGLGQVPGPKMEPIFAKITNEIKSVQMTQHQYEQYISAVKSCYEKLFLDMANELDSVQKDYDIRLSNLEHVVSNMVPGAFSKPSDNRLMGLSSLATLSYAAYVQLVLIVGLAMSMIFFRMRRKKKTDLKMPSNKTPTPKSTASVAKKAETPPTTPSSLGEVTSSSSGEVSPSSINNAVTKKKEEEPLLQNEIVENGHATDNQPALVRIISSDEKENTRAAANCQG